MPESTKITDDHWLPARLIEAGFPQSLVVRLVARSRGDAMEFIQLILRSGISFETVLEILWRRVDEVDALGKEHVE